MTVRDIVEHFPYYGTCAILFFRNRREHCINAKSCMTCALEKDEMDMKVSEWNAYAREGNICVEIYCEV